MELVYADIELINSFDLLYVKRNLIPKEEVKRMNIKIQVGNACSLVINEMIQTQLDLPFMEKRIFRMDDGRIVEYDLVGPVEIRFADRSTSCSAIVLPGNCEPLLGSTPMLALDVIVDPKRGELISNPESSLVKFHTMRLIKQAMRLAARV